MQPGCTKVAPLQTLINTGKTPKKITWLHATRFIKIKNENEKNIFFKGVQLQPGCTHHYNPYG